MGDTRVHTERHTDLPWGLDTAQLIDRANEESARCQHEHFGTEHLALALSRLDDTASPLRALGIDRQRLHTLLDATIRSGSGSISSDMQRPLTSRTKQALSLAAGVARELGHSRVEVPHLLVGLMRERLNIGAMALADQGLTKERAFEFARASGACVSAPLNSLPKNSPESA